MLLHRANIRLIWMDNLKSNRLFPVVCVNKSSISKNQADHKYLVSMCCYYSSCIRNLTSRSCFLAGVIKTVCGALHRPLQKGGKAQAYTPWTIKRCHFVFDYNPGVSCSIFIVFAPVETGRNTLQFSYLIAWWLHNSVIIHVTKVYFSSEN